MRTKDESLFAVIVDYVNDYFEKYGRSPSTREIESGTQISRPTVQRYLKALQERGEIEYGGHRSSVKHYFLNKRLRSELYSLKSHPKRPCGQSGHRNIHRQFMSVWYNKKRTARYGIAPHTLMVIILQYLPQHFLREFRLTRMIQRNCNTLRKNCHNALKQEQHSFVECCSCFLTLSVRCHNYNFLNCFLMSTRVNS